MERERWSLDEPSPAAQLALWLLLALLIVSVSVFGILSVTPHDEPSAELSLDAAAQLDRVWHLLGAAQAKRVGDLTADADRLAEARILLDTAEAEAPNHYKTRFYRGLERLASGDNLAARRSLEEAAKLSEPEERLPVFLTLSAVLTDLKDYAAAEIVLRQALDIAPNSPAVWANLGQVLWLLGDKEASVEAYKKKLALEGKPVDPEGPI